MYVSRALRGGPKELQREHYDENDMVDLIHKMKKLNFYDKYMARVEAIVADSVYDEAAKFACMYFDKYACVDINKGIFYVYHNNMWRVDHGHRLMTRDLINYTPMAGKSHRYRSEIIKDISHHMYVDMFMGKLGEYKAINMNGTSFDFVSGDIRSGQPCDYTSISTPISISVDYRDEVESMLHDIFPDVSVYRYFLRFAGSLLIPGNHDKIFMVWSGSGDNGKSVLARLIELTLGEYAVKLPTSLVTGKRTSSGSATPEMTIIEKKLVAFLQEPGLGEKLNNGIVKELTGNDSVYVRGLYESGRNISIRAKIIYIVNSTDNLVSMENAVWNRIVVVPFTTHFTDRPRLANERKKDIHLMSKLHRYAGSFLSILVDQAREYISEGLLECDCIRTTTKKVMRENDHVGIYLQSDMVKTYPAFVEYMKQIVPNETIPGVKEFEERKRRVANIHSLHTSR